MDFRRVNKATSSIDGSLYFVKDLKVGEAIAADAIRSVRLRYLLPAPKYYDELLGKKGYTDGCRQYAEFGTPSVDD